MSIASTNEKNETGSFKKVETCWDPCVATKEIRYNRNIPTGKEGDIGRQLTQTETLVPAKKYVIRFKSTVPHLLIPSWATQQKKQKQKFLLWKTRTSPEQDVDRRSSEDHQLGTIFLSIPNTNSRSVRHRLLNFYFAKTSRYQTSSHIQHTRVKRKAVQGLGRCTRKAVAGN